MRPQGNRARVLLGIAGAGLVAAALLPRPQAAAADTRGEPWPVAVKARYRLQYMGIDVGQLEMTSTTSGKSYALSGSGKVSVLFGAITWSGSASVSGAIEDGQPAPASYGLEWHNNKKGGLIQMRFKDRTAQDIKVEPPPSPHPDLVPVKPVHKADALDPVSAVMMLTRADGRAPCDRRVGIFDGKQRYDIVFTFKRTMPLPASAGGAPGEIAYVCRAMYEPIAGHRDNEATKTYASNRDVEVVMRKIAGTEMLIPYAVTIPTAWGTGSMVTERIEVSTAKVGRIALTK